MKALAEIKNPSRHLHRIKLVCLFTTFVFSLSNSFHSPPHPQPPILLCGKSKSHPWKKPVWAWPRFYLTFKGGCFKTDKNLRVMILLTMRMLTWYAVFQKVFCHRFHAVRNSISTGTPPSASPGVESWCSDFNDFNSYVWRKIAIFAPPSVAMSIPVAKTCGGETLIILKNKKHGEGRRCGTEIILISFEKKKGKIII